MSQCSPAKTITSAAYLLFYRRQSDDAPLGPPTVNNWFRQYWDGGNDSDSSSRAESPVNNSGKDQRLDEVTSKGSSSALVVAGAGRHLRGGAGGLGATNNLTSSNLDDSYDADEDEGIGMDYQEAMIGPVAPPSYHSEFALQDTYNHAGWGFGSLLDSKERDDDNDSNQAADGEEDVGGAALRDLEAFGDDLEAFQTGGNGVDSTHHTSPIAESLEYDHGVRDVEDSFSMLGDHNMDHDEIITLGQMDEEEVEAPVAEVRIDDDDMVEHGMEHRKKD